MEKNKKTTCAIICEYNPFHTGHKYLIEKAKERVNIDYFLGLMSGNFSQRSYPCILDKYSRAEIACKNSLDLIVNLPTAFCVNNAEIFALSSIKILNQIKVDYICFGVENLNKEAFFSLAKFLLKEPNFFKKDLKENLKQGLSYNQSLINVLNKNINVFKEDYRNDILEILSKANNVLALEYIKALIKTKSKIKPIFIKRVDNYNNDKIIENFSSATNIRDNILNNNFEKIKQYLPENSYDYFKNFNLNFNVFNNLILYNLKTINKTKLSKIYSVNEGLENRIKSIAEKHISYENFYKELLTKRYKQNKINAILLNSMFNIDKKLIRKLYTIKSNILVKILAINNKNKDILSNINTNCLLIRGKDYNKHIFNKFNMKLLKIENEANSLYKLLTNNNNFYDDDKLNKMRTINI